MVPLDAGLWQINTRIFDMVLNYDISLVKYDFSGNKIETIVKDFNAMVIHS